MKIAVASNGEKVSGHFGRCENFNIYEVSGGGIISEKNVLNPGHKPGFLPVFLKDMGVNVIISGGMGGGAADLFNENSIEVVVGAEGEAKTAVSNYLRGDLKSTGSVCEHKHEHEHEHEHDGECCKH